MAKSLRGKIIFLCNREVSPVLKMILPTMILPKLVYTESCTNRNFMHTYLMQPIQEMSRGLRALADGRSRVFALSDLRALLPEHRNGSFKSVVTRLEKRGDLVRVCRGIYILPDSTLTGSELLGRTAARLRASHFNYLSLETVLSDAGAISQIPMGRIMLMSSGRSSVISCGAYGSIEFVHTRKKAAELAPNLTYDSGCSLWRASVPLALQDMRDTRRDTGLVNWKDADESI